MAFKGSKWFATPIRTSPFITGLHGLANPHHEFYYQVCYCGAQYRIGQDMW